MADVLISAAQSAALIGDMACPKEEKPREKREEKKHKE